MQFLVFYTHTDTYNSSFVSRLFPIIKLASTLTRDVFMSVFYHFDHIKSIHCSYSITAPIAPVHANDEWIVMNFLKIQIYKRWLDHTLLIIHGNTSYSLSCCQWSSKTQQYQYQNSKHLHNESRHLYNTVFFHEIFVNACNMAMANINIIVVNWKTVDISIEPSLLHVINCDISWNIT